MKNGSSLHVGRDTFVTCCISLGDLGFRLCIFSFPHGHFDVGIIDVEEEVDDMFC